MSDTSRSERIHNLDVTLWVGKQGIGAVVDELDDQLDDRDFVKVKFHRAARGGAVYDSSDVGEATPLFRNSILTGNTARDEGGQAYSYGLSSVARFDHSLLQIEGPADTTVAGNGSIFFLDESESPVSLGNSTNLDTLPRFAGGPALSGADGQLRTADDSLALTVRSPALDAGRNTALDTTGDNTRDITTDITGASGSRVQDLDGDETATVNMGAYETARPAPPEPSRGPVASA